MPDVFPVLELVLLLSFFEVSAFAFVVDVLDPVEEAVVLLLPLFEEEEPLEPEDEPNPLLLPDVPDDDDDDGELEELPDKFED